MKRRELLVAGPAAVWPGGAPVRLRKDTHGAVAPAQLIRFTETSDTS